MPDLAVVTAAVDSQTRQQSCHQNGDGYRFPDVPDTAHKLAFRIIPESAAPAAFGLRTRFRDIGRRIILTFFGLYFQ